MDPLVPTNEWLAHGMSGLLLFCLAAVVVYLLRVLKEKGKVEAEKARLEVEYREANAKLQVEYREKVEALKDQAANKMEAFYEKLAAREDRGQVLMTEVRDALRGLRGGRRDP